MAAIRSNVPGSGYGSAYVDSLIWGGTAWDTATGPIRYLFGDRANFAAASKIHGSSFYLWEAKDAEAWTTGEIQAFKAAMSTYAKVCGLTFAPASSAADANIVWWKTNIWDGSAGVHETPNEDPEWGYFNPTDDWQNLKLGGDGRNTIMHELGHAMGLAHPHDGGWSSDATRFPGVSSSGDTGRYGLNQGIWTVMSYNSGWDHRDHDAAYGAQGGLGALDIAALQALYGANLGTATGNNVYTLPTRNGSGTGWSCIWDAGGVDTISALHSRQSVMIDLRPATVRDNDPHAGGYVSAQSGVAGGFTIAKGVVIENAIGGSGNDRINGNAEANRLRGMKGNDTLRGYDGNDRLEGGAGRDVLIGGNGHDTFVFDTTPDKNKVDRIEDFHPGEDVIRLEDAVFKALSRGLLADDAFRIGGKALDRTDHVLYDAKTGVLAYDSDGAGPKAPVPIAILKTHPVLHSSDFVVV